MDGAIYPVNVTWVTADDVCTTHTCVMNYTSGCPEIVAAEKYDCAPVDLKECVKKGGSIYGNESTSGCCKLCNSVATPCERSVNREILNTTINGHVCWSATKQDVAICSGSCQTSQSYDENTGLPNGICRCCKTAMTSKKTYSMYCDDGTNRDHEHVEIMACGCEETACEAVTTPSP
uniref:CTCK domain-containing protein n=1 Tax=Ciona savignyi TaxID=51511 RepID=H2Y7G9_CIOSA